MAQVRNLNVIIVDTTGDTVNGPIRVDTIRLVAGSGAAATASIAVGGVTVWTSSEVVAKGVEESRQLNMQAGGNAPLTITLAGAGAKLYIYHR